MEWEYQTIRVDSAACRSSGLLRSPILSLRPASLGNPVLDVALPRLWRDSLRPPGLASVSAPSRRPYSGRLLGRSFFSMGGLVDPNALATALNEEGSKGWELVTGLGTQDTTGSTRALVLVLKRPKA